MKNKKTGFKNFVQLIKELKKTERGKSFLFLGGYFIFFVVLTIVIVISGNVSKLPLDQHTDDDSDMYSAARIFSGNYRFIYTIDIDDVQYIYSGISDGEKRLFEFNNNKYYYDGKNYFINTDGVWVSNNDPFIYEDFINFQRLGEVIYDATYISKSEFESGKLEFKYLISSNSLLKNIENIDTDIMEEPNKIVFTADSDAYLNKAELDLSSYGKYKGISNNHFTITLEYFDFDTIDDIIVN